jgi:hypothetical protein
MFPTSNVLEFIFLNTESSITALKVQLEISLNLLEVIVSFIKDYVIFKNVLSYKDFLIVVFVKFSIKQFITSPSIIDYSILVILEFCSNPLITT